MKQVNTIVKSPYEVDNTEGLWLDTSNPDAPVLKVLSNGSWKVLGTAKEVLDTFEVKSNKATTINESSTDAQYPSAKAVYDAIEGAGGDSTVIIDAHDWESKRNDAVSSRGLTKEEASQALDISEEELDRLVPTSSPNKNDNYCVIFSSVGYYLPNYKHYGSGEYSWYEGGTKVYHEGEASEVNFMVIDYNNSDGFVLLSWPRIVARLPVSDGDPVLYDIYGNMIPPM